MSRAPGPNVAFYTQGIRTPSARFRVEQFLPHFGQAGIGCTVYAANPSNQGETARWSPSAQPMRAILRALGVPNRLRQVHKAGRHDVVFFQKPLLGYPTARFERKVASERPCVFDLDDALYLKTHGERWVRDIVAVCERVVVGNSHLAEWIARPERTVIIPTVVDTDRYTPRPPPDGPFTLGWTGIAHNLSEFEPILPALRKVLRETNGRLLLISERFTAPWLKELPVECVQWSPETEVSAMAKVHVGLMPLADTPFNRGKCGFKLIQYMARAIPVVASPVSVNRDIVKHGENGLLAQSPGEWADALLSLYRAPERMAAMGQAARTHAEQSYSVRAVSGRYVELFRALG